jgi:DHA1 family bicyclomycin/chloramphenicol resistance-like MFS transporter
MSAKNSGGLGSEARASAAASIAERSNTTLPSYGWRLVLTLSALLGFASISTDLYLPAMPNMARSVRAEPGLMEWTISVYLMGFSVVQLFWGPISDRYGRRIPICVGLTLFVLGSAGCGLAQDGTTLIVCRVFQALGACAGVVLARAVVRDLYDGDRAAEMLSMLMSVMAIAPMVGPILGGQILAFMGWRSIFGILVAIGVLMIFAVLRLPETLPPDRRIDQPLSSALLGLSRNPE